MDRRYFCKIASLAAGAIGLHAIPVSAMLTASPGGGAVSAPVSDRCTTKLTADCRVTVLRRECHQDLQALYLDDPDAGPCQLYKSGDDFHFAAGSACPADFCPRLWTLICAAVSSQPCLTGRDQTTTLLACPDGTRPVIVRVDRL